MKKHGSMVNLNNVEHYYCFDGAERQMHECCGQVWGDLGALSGPVLAGFSVDQHHPSPWSRVSQCGICGSVRGWEGTMTEITEAEFVAATS